MALVIGLALLGEVIEWWLGFRFAKRYGGSRRAGWGALVGDLGGGCGVGAGSFAAISLRGMTSSVPVLMAYRAQGGRSERLRAPATCP